jgi:hypothetical protein
VFQDPELLRQIVRQQNELFIAEATNHRLARSASLLTHAELVAVAAMKGLLRAAVTIGVAMAIFLMVTLAAQLWLANATSTARSGHTYPVPSYAHVTPDPHP